MFDLRYYNKKGEPVSFSQWMVLCQDPEYRRVDKTDFPGGDFVSTVLLGLNHSYDGGGLKIFESMSFENDEWVEQVRYATEEEAKVGHTEMVARVMAKKHLKQHPFGRTIDLED